MSHEVANGEGIQITQTIIDIKRERNKKKDTSINQRRTKRMVTERLELSAFA